MIYVMSDIHGCFDKYQKMLRWIDFAPEDTLNVLGDVIDRVPDGIKILQDECTAAVCLPWLMEEVTSLEISRLDESQIAALSEWIANGGTETLYALQRLDAEERVEILEYFQEMELYEEVEAGGQSFVLTHSGLEHFAPEKALNAYELQDFLFCRAELEKMYYADKIVVFGHTPTAVLGGENQILRRETWIDIDCGCAFRGGQLGCLCLDTMEEFYV